MNQYSDKSVRWLNEVRKNISGMYDTYVDNSRERGLSKEEIENGKAKYFIWDISTQELHSAPGPLEMIVLDEWVTAPSSVKKELVSKENAVDIAAKIMLNELGIDIRDQVKLNRQPCYLLDQKARAIDWGQDEEEGCKRVKKIIRDANCDYGTALRCYWNYCPDYYTQFSNAKEIELGEQQNTFKVLKEIEKKLLEGFYTSNKIPFSPPTSYKLPKKRRWDIPEKLCKPNFERAVG